MHTRTQFVEWLDQSGAAWPPFISKRMGNHFKRMISKAIHCCGVDNLTCINPAPGCSRWSVLSVWWGWHHIFSKHWPCLASCLRWVTRNHWTLTLIFTEMTRTKFHWQGGWKLCNTLTIYDAHNGTAGSMWAVLLLLGVISLFLSQFEKGIIVRQ